MYREVKQQWLIADAPAKNKSGGLRRVLAALLLMRPFLLYMPPVAFTHWGEVWSPRWPSAQSLSPGSHAAALPVRRWCLLLTSTFLNVTHIWRQKWNRASTEQRKRTAFYDGALRQRRKKWARQLQRMYWSADSQRRGYPTTAARADIWSTSSLFPHVEEEEAWIRSLDMPFYTVYIVTLQIRSAPPQSKREKNQNWVI